MSDEINDIDAYFYADTINQDYNDIDNVSEIGIEKIVENIINVSDRRDLLKKKLNYEIK